MHISLYTHIHTYIHSYVYVYIYTYICIRNIHQGPVPIFTDHTRTVKPEKHFPLNTKPHRPQKPQTRNPKPLNPVEKGATAL